MVRRRQWSHSGPDGVRVARGSLSGWLQAKKPVLPTPQVRRWGVVATAQDVPD